MDKLEQLIEIVKNNIRGEFYAKFEHKLLLAKKIIRKLLEVTDGVMILR